MAVIVGRQKMTVVHAEGEHTIFPSADPQSLPDHLLDHPHVQGGVESGWITVVQNVNTSPEWANKTPDEVYADVQALLVLSDPEKRSEDRPQRRRRN